MTKHHVLIVDDDVVIRTVVRAALGDDEFSFREADDGVAALDAIREERPDLVLCDYEMPRMDGFELVRILKTDEKLRSLPVVMLTAHDSYRKAMDGIEAGADEYVVKPFDVDQLRATVLAQLERSE